MRGDAMREGERKRRVPVTAPADGAFITTELPVMSAGPEIASRFESTKQGILNIVTERASRL